MRIAFIASTLILVPALVTACVGDSSVGTDTTPGSDAGGGTGMGAQDGGGGTGSDGGGGGGGNDGGGGGGTDAGSGGGNTHVVFITSAPVHGTDIGGLDGADTICTNAAKGKQPGTSYRAWLSDGTGSPASRFDTSSSAKLVGTSGATISTSIGTLLSSGMITAAVDHDENGVAVTGTPVNVWSNVNPDGTPTASSNSPTYHCAGWTAAGMQGYLGHATDIANGNWTQSNSFQACTVGARLYCFQQQ